MDWAPSTVRTVCQAKHTGRGAGGAGFEPPPVDQLEEFPLTATVNRAVSGAKRKLTLAQAKDEVFRCVRDGMTVADAMRAVDRAEATYKDWRKQDPAFAAKVDEMREVARAARRRSGKGNVEVPDFPEFCAEYLDMPMPHHHMRIWDVLNGVEPRDLHPSIRYAAGRPGRLLVNLPPYHAKTQVWTVNYCVWRMMQDANVRIAVVSQTQQFAKKIIHQVKQILTLPQFAKLHAAFMPEGGWKGDSWTRTEIYLAGVDRAQNDPTLQALGLGGQIYGSRLDVILCDDLVTGKNVHTYKELSDWIGSEVANRMDDDGVLHVLGTRMGVHDLYSELRDLVEWDGESPVWTYFAQPAVLETPDPHPSSWVTLWPDKWPGESLVRLKAEASASRWQLTYQQQDASVDQIFPTGAVMASIDGRRAAGPQPDRGLYTVLGVDPAGAGFTAMIVLGYDRALDQRLVLDGHNQARMPPEQLIEKIKSLVVAHNVRELVVEENAFQSFLVRNQELRDFCFTRGCLLTGHYTGARKWDENLGVASLAPLFLSAAEHDLATDKWTPRPVLKHLISLPAPKFSTFVDELTNQLTTWQPREHQRQQHTKTDLVMALWFANIGIQKVIDQARNVPRHTKNEFLTRADAGARGVYNLHELREKQLRQQYEVSFYTGSPA